jgi:hypothetical protein
MTIFLYLRKCQAPICCAILATPARPREGGDPATLSPETACHRVRSDGFFLQLQTGYDLMERRRELGPKLKAIKARRAA